MNARMSRILLLVIAALAAACYQVTDYARQPPLVTKAQWTKAVVELQFVDDVDKITRECGSALMDAGCTTTNAMENGLPSYTIRVQQPSDFNDQPRLAYLGHECWHAFGATHQ